MALPSDKLARTIKPPGSNSLSARLASQKREASVDLNKFANKLALVFDDSGSMMGSTIENAKKGVEAFLQTSNPNDTAVAIYPLNAKKQSLANNIGLLYAYTMGISATGGTPIFRVLQDILKDNTCTRVILFSDGEPTDRQQYKITDGETNFSEHIDMLPSTAAAFREKSIPIDTVYIGSNDSKFLQELAELTGGIYLHFTDSSVFGKNLKYLAPAHRGMLTDGNLRAKIEKGEI